jgi:PPK2 family polyphosphate:nucleotide phosphotransferase
MLVKPGTKVRLKEIDPNDTGSYASEEEADAALKPLLDELGKLQYLLYAENKHALLIVLQGMDTSGKDGTIRKVMGALTPLGVEVKDFKKPTEEELEHDFLWRIHKAVPHRGNIGIFNRSHYEDVGVVRVHELVPPQVWKKRYRQINEFERLLVKNGTVVLKFFLHISKDEQKERLIARLQDPTKHWKFSLRDVEERQHWPAYRKAYEAALTRCSTRWAPWHIVPANKKWYRDLVVAKAVVETLRGLDMKYPPATIDISKIVIE